MIKAEVNNGVIDAEVEGTKTEILADLSVLVLSVFERLEKVTGIPKEIHKTIFMTGLITIK